MCVSMIEEIHAWLCVTPNSVPVLCLDRPKGEPVDWVVAVPSGAGWGGVGGVLDKKGSTAGQTPPPPETHPRRISLDGGARSDFNGNALPVGGREMTTTGMRFSPMSCLGRHLRSTPVFRCGRLSMCLVDAPFPCSRRRRPPAIARPSVPVPVPVRAHHQTRCLPPYRPTGRPSD